jgi:predicted Zn-dependent protease
MSRRLRQLVAVVLIALLAPASAGAQLGKITKKMKRAFDTFTPWTPEQEEEIGRAGAAKMIAVLGLYDEPNLTEYVNLVGNTVARQGERNLHYRFAVLNTPVVNAFALPGGYIFVTRGALATMKNEAELAGTLAHEVAHVDGRHLEKAVRKKKATAWAWEEGSAKIPPSTLTQIADDIVNAAIISRPDPGQESEADRNGTGFAAGAGYQAAGLRDFLQTLATAAEDKRNEQALGMWNGQTHPPFPERIAALDKILKQYGESGEVLQQRFAQNLAARPRTAVAKTEQPAGAPTKASKTGAAAAGASSLVPTPSKGTGTVHLTSTPPGGDIMVDTSFVGQTPSTLRLPAGKHTVRVILEGHQPWTRTITLHADSEIRLNATLAK